MAGYGGKDSLYEVLGVYRSSSAKDIERAYRRLRAELEKDAAPPERLTLVREAHEVLSDPQKRAAYDASLKSDEFLRPESARRAQPAVKWVPIAVIAVAILAEMTAVRHGVSEPSWAAKPAARFDPSACEVAPTEVKSRQT